MEQPRRHSHSFPSILVAVVGRDGRLHLLGEAAIKVLNVSGAAVEAWAVRGAQLPPLQLTCIAEDRRMKCYVSRERERAAAAANFPNSNLWRCISECTGAEAAPKGTFFKLSKGNSSSRSGAAFSLVKLRRLS